MARSIAALCLFLACATGPDKLDPQNPGDPYVDSCPQRCVRTSNELGLCAEAPQL
jgi:hypothetical protein